MTPIPQVPMDEENRVTGRIVLNDGVVVELPISVADLNSGGVIFDITDVHKITRGSEEITAAEAFELEENEQTVWIPGQRIKQVILASRPRRDRRAGF